VKISILYLSKEGYPNNRVRINELFLNEFSKINKNIFWVFQSNEIKKGRKIININNNNITLYPYCFKGFFLKSIFNRFCKLKKYFISKEILNRNNIDIIISNDGIIEGYIGYLLAKKYKIPFAFYLSSLFFIIDREEFKENYTLKNFYKFIESYVKEKLYKDIIKRSDIFHPITNQMVLYYRKILHKDKNIFPLPICPGNNIFEIKKEKYNYDRPMYLIYHGTLGRTRKIETIINIFYLLLLKINNIEIKFNIIGKFSDVKYEKEIKDKISKLHLSNKIFIKKEIDLKNIGKEIAKSDIGLSIYPPLLSWNVGSPTKLVEYLAIGIPVVANSEIVEQKNLIKLSGCGKIGKWDQDIIVKNILDIIYNYNNEFKKSQKGRILLKQNWTYKKLSKELSKFYDNYFNEKNLKYI